MGLPFALRFEFLSSPTHPSWLTSMQMIVFSDVALHDVCFKFCLEYVSGETASGDHCGTRSTYVLCTPSNPCFFFSLALTFLGATGDLPSKSLLISRDVLPVGTRPRLQAPAINDDTEPLSRPAPPPGVLVLARPNAAP